MLLACEAKTQEDFNKIIEICNRKNLVYATPDLFIDPGHRYILFETDGKKRVELRTAIGDKNTLISLEKCIEELNNL